MTISGLPFRSEQQQIQIQYMFHVGSEELTQSTKKAAKYSIHRTLIMSIFNHLNLLLMGNLLNTNYNQQSELLAVAVQTGNVFLYNTTFKNQFQLLSKFSTGSNLINSLFISQDGNWLYIASDVKGVFMMSIKKQQLYEDNNNINDTSVKLIVAAHGTFGLRAQQVIVSKDNHYIYAFDFWYGFFYTNVEENINLSF
ncbi:hypothetical protein TTHERM_02418110 (macronuclear) [Tetrahymena thermophila SB210]|uniref:Uncharacterized protein n=1 Tax=Tetrahymena thermophila (strain SB210) TaxID=312017 RepID=Q224P6_TETTS|nr:hypothetical protein TTHERM_02418110 [Tetrahymena thermophila SB210]EAR80762.2 hypothetical protein TTHERM_02418110 [Tetrahymena thermophila SB210]|eukprot:XP_001028425.2 hypothetical protein TTHERM_02418110 [Tetrahymena thermophila SB210]